MSRAFGYFRLQLKRFFRLLPVVLVLSAMLLGAIGMAFFGLFADSGSDEQDSLIGIGIVGNMDDAYMDLAIGALQNLDSSRFSLSVKMVEDEETAADMLLHGELAAYLVMPPDFIAEAIRGNMQLIPCVTSAGAEDFGSRIAYELMTNVTEMVANSQKAVFGFQDVAEENGVERKKAQQMGDEIAFEVIHLVVDREKAYDVETIGDAGTGMLKDPLVCGMLVLLLMLWGITCCTVFCARNGTLHRVLAAKGTGAGVQVLGEYAAYLIFMTAMVGAFTLILAAASPILPSMELLDSFDFSRLVPGLFLPVLTISSMQFFLYEVTSGPVSSALLQFFCAMGTGYICGCVYPAHYFPRAVQNVASLLPAWSCRLWCDELLAKRPAFSTVAVLVGYCLAFLLLSAVVRRARIKRAGGAA